MNEAYISIPMTLFGELPESVQKTILGSGENTAPVSDDDVEGPVELTVAQVRKLLSAFKEKTTLILKEVAKSPTPEFKLKDLIAAVPDAENNGHLRGVFSAITRRTRFVCDDSDVDFFWWKEDHVYDDDGELVDLTGYVSALTHSSLQKVLNR